MISGIQVGKFRLNHTKESQELVNYGKAGEDALVNKLKDLLNVPRIFNALAEVTCVDVELTRNDNEYDCKDILVHLKHRTIKLEVETAKEDIWHVPTYYQLRPGKGWHYLGLSTRKVYSNSDVGGDNMSILILKEKPFDYFLRVSSDQQYFWAISWERLLELLDQKIAYVEYQRNSEDKNSNTNYFVKIPAEYIWTGKSKMLIDNWAGLEKFLK